MAKRWRAGEDFDLPIDDGPLPNLLDHWIRKKEARRRFDDEPVRTPPDEDAVEFPPGEWRRLMMMW